MHEDHDLKAPKRQAVYQFYAKTFGLDVSQMKLPNGLINESPNTIESAETMHVYNAEHPLPENALKDGDAVFQTFQNLIAQNKE